MDKEVSAPLKTLLDLMPATSCASAETTPPATSSTADKIKEVAREIRVLAEKIEKHNEAFEKEVADYAKDVMRPYYQEYLVSDPMYKLILKKTVRKAKMSGKLDKAAIRRLVLHYLKDL